MPRLLFFLTLLACLAGCAPIEPPPARVSQSETRVLMVVTSADRLMDGSSGGYYLAEVVDFYEVVNAAGIAVDIASPKGGQAPMYDRPTALSGRRTKEFLVQTGLLADLDATMPLGTVNVEDYAAIYYVGGFAALMDFSTDPAVADAGARIYESGGVVTAVCHGPAALVNMKLSSGEYLIQGKKITGRSVQEDGNNSSGKFPFLLEVALRERGGEYSKGPPGAAHVQVDGRLITGQGPSATKDVAQALVAQLAAR